MPGKAPRVTTAPVEGIPHQESARDAHADGRDGALGIGAAHRDDCDVAAVALIKSQHWSRAVLTVGEQ